MSRIVRSRSGCGQCKSAKVKCDELKPSCGRCAKRGTMCSYDVNIVTFKGAVADIKLQKKYISMEETLQSLQKSNFANEENTKDFIKVLKLQKQQKSSETNNNNDTGTDK